MVKRSRITHYCPLIFHITAHLLQLTYSTILYDSLVLTSLTIMSDTLRREISKKGLDLKAPRPPSTVSLTRYTTKAYVEYDALKHKDIAEPNSAAKWTSKHTPFSFPCFVVWHPDLNMTICSREYVHYRKHWAVTARGREHPAYYRAR